MQDYPTKVDNVSTEPAAEYNNLASELKTMLSSLGIAFNAGSVQQMAEAVGIYALIGQYYTDGGTPNTYVLSASPGTRIDPSIYYTGMKVSFIPANINTGASTVNVAGLGAKNIVLADGSTALSGGELNNVEFFTLIYDGTNFRIDEKTASGENVQVVNTQTGAVQAITGNIPYDDTIPQNTEGDEVMTLAITPTSATNKLKIDVVTFIDTDNSSNPAITALFQDSTANSLAAGAGCGDVNGEDDVVPVKFTHFMTAGTTSLTTFKVRVGMPSGNCTFNGESGIRRLGGVMASSITIAEIKV